MSVEQPAHITNGSGVIDAEPDWSPDGKQAETGASAAPGSTASTPASCAAVSVALGPISLRPTLDRTT